MGACREYARTASNIRIEGIQPRLPLTMNLHAEPLNVLPSKRPMYTTNSAAAAKLDGRIQISWSTKFSAVYLHSKICAYRRRRCYVARLRVSQRGSRSAGKRAVELPGKQDNIRCLVQGIRQDGACK